MNTLKRTIPIVKRNITSPEILGLTSKVQFSTISKPEEEKLIIVKKEFDYLITKIAINRPHRKNALDKVTTQYLVDALDEFENDNKSLVAILHGEGGNFCAGIDLHELAEYDRESEDQIPQFGLLSRRYEIPFKKPVIASINGYTLGAGLELALMCDLRLTDDTTVMGFFNRKSGIPNLLGSTIRLPKMIGFSRAMDLILSGRSINAKEALDWGLVNELVACGSALGQSFMLARSFVKFPRESLIADRASTYHGSYSTDEWEEKLQFHRDNASYLLYEEGVPGAKHFKSGIGRHGRFKNLLIKSKHFKELDKELL